jgi:exonuclease III
MDNMLKIFTFNTKGLKGPKKRERVLTWLKNKDADLILMQESHFQHEDKDNWEDKWKGKIYNSPGTNNSRGVSLLIKNELSHKLLDKWMDKEGRWLICLIDINNQKYCIANYYGPNTDDTGPLIELLDKIDNIDSDITILGGDFNFVYDTNLDKLGGTNSTNKKCRDMMLNWQLNNNMVDIWRMRNPGIRKYTWTSNSKPRIHCRLDHILIDHDTSKLVAKSNIIPGFSSDHSIVELKLNLAEEDRGRGFWKFNAKLLKDEEYKITIENTIYNTLNDNPGCSARLFWDILKCNMRRDSIRYGIRKRRKEKEEEQRLLSNIDHLEEVINWRITNQLPTDTEEERLWEEKGILNRLWEDECRGAAIRSKSQNYEEGEKATRYYLNLEKGKSERKNIKILLDENVKEINDNKEILEEQLRFYEDLFSNKDYHIDPTIQKELNNLLKEDRPQLEEEEWEELEKEITEEEIAKIIQHNPPNKSPGTDGFTNEFYKYFWYTLKNYLLAAYKEAINYEEMCISQKRGAILLLPK